MKPVTIGLIGYGAIGRVHALGYRAIPFHYGIPAESVQIGGVATSNASSAAKAAQEIGCSYWTADYRELLARPEIQAVDINVPNHLHEEIVLAAAAAGKHIYCEKPLAVSVAQGKRMVQAADDAGVITQMTFNFRFFPALERARQLIGEGFLGKLYSFRGRYYRSSYIDPAKPLSWKLRSETSGAGALYDLGAHIVDMLYSLLGEFGAVQASLETVIRERPVAVGATEMAPVDVDDIALLHVRLRDGTLGVVEASRLGTGFTNELTFEIFGEKGSIRFDAADSAFLEVYDVRAAAAPMGGRRGITRIEVGNRYPGAKMPDWTMAPGFLRAHAECQAAFLRAVAEGRPSSPSLADGLHVQALLEAALHSSRQQRWVSVDEIMQGK